MKKTIQRHPTLLIALLIPIFLSGCAALRPALDFDEIQIPPVDREFRAVWIATVANIDWPSQPGLSPEQQKAELREMFDRVRALNMNAVILQVRPAADALYESEYEPWSEYLTGAMGKAPEPYYDPLTFAVEEAHKRGLELHAWFNPFRARHPSARSEIDSGHVSVYNPGIVRTYGSHLWLDPGMDEARRYSLDVIIDVVQRYDIDGVHIDDYFYPYKERDSLDNLIDFPDSLSYACYLETVDGEPLSRDDWRRNNVDRFVEDLYREIKATKPHVKFGISPFGIWRPGYPEQIQGFDAYAEIYADAKLWLVSGWVDYFTPQLYWPIDQRAQSYPVLLEWWYRQNLYGRHLWPGNFTSRVTDSGNVRWPADEIVRQIELTRQQTGADGNVHFSMRAFQRNSDRLMQRIDTESYRTPALIPATPWLGTGEVSRPVITTELLGSDVYVTLSTHGHEPVWLWVVRSLRNDEWQTDILPGWYAGYRIVDRGTGVPPDAVAVSSVDRLGNESPAVLVQPGRNDLQRIVQN
jgi:uncharacterized lipoprotein YddW (UPF0748 family)